MNYKRISIAITRLYTLEIYTGLISERISTDWIIMCYCISGRFALMRPLMCSPFVVLTYMSPDFLKREGLQHFSVSMLKQERWNGLTHVTLRNYQTDAV